MKTALVTGAGGAIGRAIAEVLVADGWQVVGMDLAFSDEARQRLCEAVVCDLTRGEALRAELEALCERYELRGLVNCAGVTRVEPFLESEEKSWRELLEVNFLAPLHTCRGLVPAMVEAGSGRVVNIVTEGARAGAAGIAVYSGAKGAVLAFSKCLAQEVARAGVTVNCVSPGTIDTPMTGANPELTAKLARRIPVGRLGRADDVAAAVAFLMGDAAGYITGQVISVGGGISMIG